MGSRKPSVRAQTPFDNCESKYVISQYITRNIIGKESDYTKSIEKAKEEAKKKKQEKMQ